MPEIAPKDLEVCRALLARGSKSFALAGRVLPPRVRAPAAVLYAFCRVADDAVDGSGADPSAVHTLDERLTRVYAGRPMDDAVDRALTAVVAATRLPRTILDALLDGFRWDVEGRCYETLEDLEAYAARVAGTVGVMMAVVMGTRSREALARACDLGVAMQLTNVARDVGEDAARGRLYLPRAWLRDEGIVPETWLARPTHDGRLARVIARLLARADALYTRADAGVQLLPRDCQLAIRAARLIYADIGRTLAKRGFDALARRAVVPTWRKLWLLAKALFRRGDPRLVEVPPLPATRFLIDACGSPPELT